jgi:hypothetical protein
MDIIERASPARALASASSLDDVLLHYNSKFEFSVSIARSRPKYRPFQARRLHRP